MIVTHRTTAAFLTPEGFAQPSVVAVLREGSAFTEAGRYAVSAFGSRGARRRTPLGSRPVRMGEPVLLVHSYSSSLEEQWVKTGLLHALAERYRAIAFDARGHGESGKPHDPAAYGAQMTWDVVRLLDHLGIERAHVVGYSMGAHIVAHLLTLAPGRLLTATLGAGAGRLDWSAADDAQTAIEADEMERGLMNAQVLRLWPTDQPRPTAAELTTMSHAALAGKDPLALAAIRRATRGQSVTAAQMAAVQVPVLGVVGSNDRYLARFQALKKVMPQLKLVVLEGATHHTALERPEFLQALLDFLRDRTSPTRC